MVVVDVEVVVGLYGCVFVEVDVGCGCCECEVEGVDVVCLVEVYCGVWLYVFVCFVMLLVV